MKEKAIPVEKPYNKEEVYQAVLTYLSPANDRQRVKTESKDNSYIIRVEVLVERPKDPKGKKNKETGVVDMISEWVPRGAVKLMFSEEYCHVDVNFGDEIGRTAGAAGAAGATLGGVGAGMIALMTVPYVVVPVVLGGGLAAGAVGGALGGSVSRKGANQIKKDIYKLVEGYLRVGKKQKSHAAGRKCRCGHVLAKGTKFCSACGRKVEEEKPKPEKLTCECGAVLPEGAKFCSVCGKKVEEEQKVPPEELVCECGAVLPGGTNFCPECGKDLR